MHRTSRAVKRIRHLFHAGRIRPVRDPRPCTQGNHAGPLLGTLKFEAFGGIWTDMGTCAACGSTVHRSQVRVAA